VYTFSIFTQSAFALDGSIMVSTPDRSFYVTCTSNKSLTHFPANTTSSFTTRLPDPIYLDNAERKWEVGLSSFSYSQAINNFGKAVLTELYVHDGNVFHSIPVPDQHITSIKEMADALNTAIVEYADVYNARVLHGNRQAIEFQRKQNRRRSRRSVILTDQQEQSDQQTCDDLLNKLLDQLVIALFTEDVEEFYYFLFIVRDTFYIIERCWEMFRSVLRLNENADLKKEYDQKFTDLLRVRYPYLLTVWLQLEFTFIPNLLIAFVQDSTLSEHYEL
jgi:hypothetical protein